jgi:hypothetical protein
MSDRLAAVTQLAADSQQIFYEYENSVRSLLGRRDEPRGLLGAHHAKAAALGAAEDLALAGRCYRARDWLWTAPCDLAAAERAVRDYQDSVLPLSGRGARS